MDLEPSSTTPPGGVPSAYYYTHPYPPSRGVTSVGHGPWADPQLLGGGGGVQSGSGNALAPQPPFQNPGTSGRPGNSPQPGLQQGAAAGVLLGVASDGSLTRDVGFACNRQRGADGGRDGMGGGSGAPAAVVSGVGRGSSSAGAVTQSQEDVDMEDVRPEDVARAVDLTRREVSFISYRDGTLRGNMD